MKFNHYKFKLTSVFKLTLKPAKVVLTLVSPTLIGSSIDVVVGGGTPKGPVGVGGRPVSVSCDGGVVSADVGVVVMGVLMGPPGDWM